MRQVFIHKLEENSYDLVCTGLLTPLSVQPLSTINTQSYDFMMNVLKGLKDSKTHPTYYQFPHYPGTPMAQVRLTKLANDCYTLDLNLAMVKLSEMDDLEYEELINELEDLRTESIGSKVYFPGIEK